MPPPLRSSEAYSTIRSTGGSWYSYKDVRQHHYTRLTQSGSEHNLVQFTFL
eukprot:COSAG02_NODE_234_length_27784_cov_12.556872_14_plen_51_part_00